LRSTFSLDMCTSPSIPDAMFTKIPKSATREIVPSIFVPAGKSFFTLSQGSASSSFVERETFSCCQSAFMIFAVISCPTFKTSETFLILAWEISETGRSAWNPFKSINAP